ncbi:MAG TPA: type II toxin-antitoxin system VapC family toxin [Fimbriimonadaceae bacterium]
MKILLDTSILLGIGLFGTSAHPKLYEAILAAETLMVSPIARVEIGIKVSIGKLALPTDEKRFWSELVKRLQATELPYSCAHAALLASLPLHHRDPFDRMLVSQCLVEDLYIATSDAIFVDYGVKTLS